MKNHLYKAALAAALGLAGATAAQAQINPNDLVLGFTSQASGANSDDYIVDLGQLPTGGNIAANYNTALDVSGFSYSAFTASGTAGAASLGSLYVGIIGGNGGTGTKDVFLSEVDNGTGSPAQAGSSLPTAAPSGTDLESAADYPIGLGVGAVAVSPGAGLNNVSWTYNIAENPTSPGADSGANYATYLGDNPMTTLNSDTIVLDLYNETGSTHTVNPWTFDGTVTLDLNTENDSLTATYDETPVPEPATCGLYALGGLLMLGLGRRFSGKAA